MSLAKPHFVVSAAVALSAIAMMSAMAFSGTLPSDRTGSAPSSATLEMSQMFLIYDVPAAAQETGLLDAVLVKAGEEVEQGQLLARIDDRQAKLEKRAAEQEREAAMARASNDIEVQYAAKSFELAKAEWEDALRINQRSEGTVARSEVRRLELAKHRASLQITKSQLDMRVAKLNAEVHRAAVEAAEEKMHRCRIEAPFDGVVMDVIMQAKQWATAGDVVIRVARLDRLRVDGLISAADFDPHEVEGRPVTVTVNLARGRTAQLSGVIVFANPLVQAGNRFRVRAEVDNKRGPDGQWLLHPGKSARTVVHIR